MASGFRNPPLYNQPPCTGPKRDAFFIIGMVVEIVLLCGTLATGLAVAGLVGVTRTRTDACILSGEVTCKRTGLVRLYTVHDSGMCSFCMNLHIVAAVFSFLFILYRIFVLIKLKANISTLRILVAGGTGLFTVLILASAAIISVSFASFCTELLDACTDPPEKQCSDFQEPWLSGNWLTFYDCTKAAEAAAWFSFFFWTMFTIFNGIVFWRARRAKRALFLASLGVSQHPAVPTVDAQCSETKANVPI